MSVIDTCKDCVYNHLAINAAKEVIRNCVRYPPTALAVATERGIAVMCNYPPIDNNTVACGEWDDGLDDGDTVIETVTPLNN